MCGLFSIFNAIGCHVPCPIKKLRNKQKNVKFFLLIPHKHWRQPCSRLRTSNVTYFPYYPHSTNLDPVGNEIHNYERKQRKRSNQHTQMSETRDLSNPSKTRINSEDSERYLKERISGAAERAAGGAQGGGAREGEQLGRRRSYRRSRHGRWDRGNWFRCTWRGSCPCLAESLSLCNSKTASASHAPEPRSSSSPLSHCRIFSAPLLLRSLRNKP